MLADLLRKLRIPSVVIEIGLGILIGQQVLGWAQVDDLVEGLSRARPGLPHVPGRLRDRPASASRAIRSSRPASGWLLSLAIAFGLAVFLVSTGFALNSLVIGLVLTTTALGTLLPMLRDADILDHPLRRLHAGHRHGGRVRADRGHRPAAQQRQPVRHRRRCWSCSWSVAVAAALLAIRPQPPKVVALLRKNLHSSSQLPVRISVLLIIVLVWLASALGLDVLLGAFAAGVVVRLLSHGEDGEVVRVKLEAIGFGFLVPIFFIVSGMKFDLDALHRLAPHPAAAAAVPGAVPRGAGHAGPAALPPRPPPRPARCRWPSSRPPACR